jgi:hypothetical protein
LKTDRASGGRRKEQMEPWAVRLFYFHIFERGPDGLLYIVVPSNYLQII